jgi:transcriptional regulator with PAS, ATPase and Fis domain
MTAETSPNIEANDAPLDGVIGSSEAMREVYRLTRLSARSQASVLLLGETGTGKELIASALHRLSDRSSGPFVRVNCGALTESLLESELFGHVKGSFTDAVRDRTGRFEAAHGGTIFLDEINSTSLTLQVKLLRVLQEREFERVGDTKTVQVDVRVVAASNCDLNKEVAEGRFREDLFWRLNVLPILLPPLRRREGDIELLVHEFLEVYSVKNGRPTRKIHPDAMKALVNYPWPGNVRELQNYIERAVVWSQGDRLELDCFPDAVVGDSKSAQSAVFRPTDEQSLIREFVYNRLSRADDQAEDLHKQIVEPVEKELLMQIMQNCNNTQTKAASRLGINRNTLYKKLQEYGLTKSNGKTGDQKSAGDD